MTGRESDDWVARLGELRAAAHRRREQRRAARVELAKARQVGLARRNAAKLRRRS